MPDFKQLGPVAIGVAVAGVGALVWMNMRGGSGAGSVYPTQLQQPAISAVDIPPADISFPPMPNFAGIGSKGDCCSACDPSNRPSTLASAQLPILKDGSFAPRLASVNADAPQPTGGPNFDPIRYVPPVGVMGPGFFPYSFPPADTMTQQVAPYVTAINTGLIGRTAIGFDPRGAA